MIRPGRADGFETCWRDGRSGWRSGRGGAHSSVSGCSLAGRILQKLFPGLAGWNPQVPASWKETWVEVAVRWAVGTVLVLIWAYAWLLPGWFSLRRAARIGDWKRSLVRGIIVAGAFVGSLFGSFWAATSMWRSYFFDPRIVPLVLVAVGLAVISGCASTITYGEMRRRELFHAMLVAWVLGLALMWRWWSRERPGRSPGSLPVIEAILSEVDARA